MSTLATLRDDVRLRLVEPSADFFTDNNLNLWINQAYRNFISRTEWNEKVKAYPLVANQYEYSLPSDVGKVQLVTYEDKYPIVWKDLEEFRRFTGPSTQSQDRPLIYRIHPWDQKIRLYPIPSSSAATTQANGAATSSDTTITVDDTSSFPSSGRVTLANGEQILYFSKTATTFAQCVRGDGFTTAAAISDNDVISDARLYVYMTYTPPDLTASIDARTPPEYDEAIVAYATAIALRTRDKYKEAEAYRDSYEKIVKLAEEDRQEQQKDQLFYIKDDEDMVGW